MADGGDAAGAQVVRDDWVERRHRSENVRSAKGRALGADTLNDVGERRIDVVGALAFDVVQLANHSARAVINRQHGVACVNGRVVVSRHLRHHIRAGAGLGNYAIETVVGVLHEHHQYLFTLSKILHNTT